MSGLWFFLIPIGFFIFFAVTVVTQGNDDYTSYYKDSPTQIERFLKTEDGYWLNINHVKGIRVCNKSPGKYTVVAYVSGICYDLKSGFSEYDSAAKKLVEILNELEYSHKRIRQNNEG